VLASSVHTRPVASIQSIVPFAFRVFTPDARICVAFIVSVLPTTISSVMTDHDDLCELASREVRRVT